MITIPTHIVAVDGIVENEQGHILLVKTKHDGVTDVPTKLMLDNICTAVGGQSSTSDETSDVRWVAKENVLDMLAAPAFRIRYQAYLDGNGGINYME
ncbi:NUDIX hydrolase [Paenibacillus dendritiformis]|uniref:NUDIX hydrolase n=1 Tax=Paenibacillus dendritiformis C454 TaxID=1131935 RepID=H3SHT2_9BACL|nr:NUDIX hydrolase [Paenibacillus dendritiformis C454]